MPNTDYICIQDATNRHAHFDGFVYEHILVAEKMLGRELTDEEVVHHKDRNKKNNDPDNLMVFATNSDHSRFHATGIAKLDGDHYVSPKITYPCKQCGKESENRTFCSQNCQHLYYHRFSPSKEELISDLLSLSIAGIAEKYTGPME